LIPSDKIGARKRQRKPISYRFTLITVLLVILAFGVAAPSFLYVYLLSPESSNKRAAKVLISIPAGTNERQIGAMLEQKHLVRHAFGFVLATRIGRLTGKMHSGSYEISPAMPPSQIASIIAYGLTSNDSVVIPEGFTNAQIAARFAARGIVDEASFASLIHDQGRSFRIGKFVPPNDNLEGYLFPDTYVIAKGTTERKIVIMMLHSFEVQALQHNNGELAHVKDLSRVINLASLVEREAKTDADRPLIAAALSNRLKRGMRLECDASVEYALPAHKSRLFYKDLRVESPYNTYLHAGLPPTPIANPGLPSIEAALHPAKVGYLYYVARPDGSHIFTSTLAQHLKAVAKVRAMRLDAKH
jgi:UPF0755 protein